MKKSLMNQKVSDAQQKELCNLNRAAIALLDALTEGAAPKGAGNQSMLID